MGNLFFTPSRLMTFDFSRQEVNATFVGVTDSSTYRPSKPYKLFTDPGRSKATLTFFIPEGIVYHGVALRLNHCRTTSDGIIDIRVNGAVVEENYDSAPRDNFAYEDFGMTADQCHVGRNTIEIILNARSPAVYWLSDATLDLALPSKKKLKKVMLEARPADQ